ncbi:MAG: LysR family transcriptional regulator [Leptolyngbya sp. SIO1E4]|nr:LysR family transcriptional regulator [Leptolyngbya sp. SIO1E4]
MEKFKAIRLFLKVVEADSFAKAANLLDLTPSAVSKSVAALESELGVQLLKRSTRSLSLTQDGAMFYERCRQLSDEYDEIESALQSAYQVPQGRLRVDMPMVVARYVVLPAIPAFLRRYPQLQLELGVNDRPIDLIREGYDAVVRIGKPKDSNLLIQPLSTLYLSTYAAPAYLAEHGEPQTPADLLRHNCLTYVYEPSGKLAEWQFDCQGKRLSLAVTGNFFSNDPAALIDAAVAGIGIHQPASFTVTKPVAAGALKPILTGYCTTGLPVSLLYPPTRHLSAKMRVFTEFIKAQFQAMAPAA